jgi:hypothetical protein
MSLINLYRILINLKWEIIIFVVAISFSVGANIININVTNLMYGPKDNILFGATLGSPDNAWYLNQIKNYLNGLGFTIDPLDPIYAVRRTPGYPLFYGVHYIIFGEAGAHYIIPYTQTFLHAFASVLLYKTALILFNDLKVSFLAGILYGLSPAVVCYLFMTLTESIFPALLIIGIYLTVSAYLRKSILKSLCAGLIVASVVLVSPRTGLTLVFVLICMLSIGKINLSERLRISCAFIIGFLIIISPWTIRNYLLLDRFIPLETYYLNHTMEDQNIKLIALTRWWSTWGSPAKDRLHGDLAGDIYSDMPYKTIDAFIDNEVPLWVYEVESKSHLKDLFIAYHNCMKKSIEMNGGRRLRYLEIPDDCENKVSAGFDSFANKIQSQYPLQAFIISPLYKSGKEYIFHSAIHTWRSFDDYKQKPVKIFLKAVAYTVNVLLWIFTLAYLLSTRSLTEKILLGSVPVTSFLFMVYYRHVEGRYLLGIYPFLYLMTAIILNGTIIPFLRKLIFHVRYSIFRQS